MQFKSARGCNSNRQKHRRKWILTILYLQLFDHATRHALSYFLYVTIPLHGTFDLMLAELYAAHKKKSSRSNTQAAILAGLNLAMTKGNRKKPQIFDVERGRKITFFRPAFILTFTRFVWPVHFHIIDL